MSFPFPIRLVVLAGLLLINLTSVAQELLPPDSIPSAALDAVELRDYRKPIQPINPLPDYQNGFIFSGKKTTLIQVQDVPMNTAEKSGRQLFGKVPGAFIYDMDGSGNQINVATRGLDPHRSWEFNVRQNGVITNSDMYGYPASHYSAPLEAIQSIALVRGTGSLQYGAQFGGMINYLTKTANPLRPLAYEGITSVGSYGLFSTFHSLGGTRGKWSYYGYAQRRVSKGYRENSESDAHAEFAQVEFRPKEGLSLKAELAHSTYLYQLPGPLTDAMFYADPRQATRSRNFYSPDIYVPSLTLNWKISKDTEMHWTTSAVLGTRNSVMFIGFADKADVVDPATLQYGTRQVDLDQYNSYTSEWRMLTRYQVGKVAARISFGLQGIHNQLHRRQLGKGTSGTDFDLSLAVPGFGRDLQLLTRNVAFFAENLFELTPKWNVSAGMRYEYGDTRMTGSISYLDGNEVPNQILHHFPLLGLNTQYRLAGNWKLYGGWSQAYRPVIFADIIPATPLDRIDKNLKDAYGYNAEAGITGSWQDRLTLDINWFAIRYNNRLGTLLTEDQGTTVLLKTNTGSTFTHGIESYVELTPWKGDHGQISCFSATSWMHATYLSGKVVSNGEVQDLAGNTLETVPTWISRNGLSLMYRSLSAVLQYSYVSESFSDALNTRTPSTNGARGLVPAYGLWDLNLAYAFARHYSLKLSLNNLTNKQYFTKRPNGYPGAGVWSSDGRVVNVTVAVRI